MSPNDMQKKTFDKKKFYEKMDQFLSTIKILKNLLLRT